MLITLSSLTTLVQVHAENKRLVEPLQKAREDVEELRRQLQNYDKDKQSLAVSSHSHPSSLETVTIGP